MAIYLDHAATTPMSPGVLAAYVDALSVVGNPSSIHSQGQNAKRMLEEAREQVAASVGADAARTHLHVGRNRVDQPRHQGPVVGAPFDKLRDRT